MSNIHSLSRQHPADPSLQPQRLPPNRQQLLLPPPVDVAQRLLRSRATQTQRRPRRDKQRVVGTLSWLIRSCFRWCKCHLICTVTDWRCWSRAACLYNGSDSCNHRHQSAATQQLSTKICLQQNWATPQQRDTKHTQRVPFLLLCCGTTPTHPAAHSRQFINEALLMATRVPWDSRGLLFLAWPITNYNAASGCVYSCLPLCFLVVCLSLHFASLCPTLSLFGQWGQCRNGQSISSHI